MITWFIDTRLKMTNFSGAKFLILFSNMGLFTTLISQKICNLHPNLSLNLHILIFRFKSDNCSQQYKFRFVFANWRVLAKKYIKTILLYCGVSGHGKWLVDSMSSFGVKGPLRKSIITEIFFSMM